MTSPPARIGRKHTVSAIRPRTGDRDDRPHDPGPRARARPQRRACRTRSRTNRPGRRRIDPARSRQGRVARRVDHASPAGFDPAKLSAARSRSMASRAGADRRRRLGRARRSVASHARRAGLYRRQHRSARHPHAAGPRLAQEHLPPDRRPRPGGLCRRRAQAARRAALYRSGARSASGAGAAADRARCTRCSASPTCSKPASPSPPSPTRRSTIPSIRSATWACRRTTPAGYNATARPITYAASLKGNLLVIHGTGDDNVHYQNTEQLADRAHRARTSRSR